MSCEQMCSDKNLSHHKDTIYSFVHLFILIFGGHFDVIFRGQTRDHKASREDESEADILNLSKIYTQLPPCQLATCDG